jgi:uncharacterized membrane protein YjdF
MITAMIQPTRNEEDHVKHVQQTIATDLNANWIIVMDNMSTHLSASLVEYIAEICAPQLDLGRKSA